MAAEQNSWGRSLLIGASVVAIGGGLWYLYSTREVQVDPEPLCCLHHLGILFSLSFS